MKPTKMVIGVTGGIASGKSTVVSFFKEWGADIIDVDKLGWEVLESKQKEVIKVFGKEVLVKKSSTEVYPTLPSFTVCHRKHL